MSRKHPIIAITGSSGAGTSSVKTAFEQLFELCNIKPMLVDGDGFHRYSRVEMARLTAETDRNKGHFSLFGTQANLLQEFEALLQQYGEHGYGCIRHYIHDEAQAQQYQKQPGTFTDWQEEGRDSDLLFYEGLHGAIVHEELNIAQHVDLKVGVVPVINLEWIQKIQRDTGERGYGKQQVKASILRRMNDYVNVITPQFSLTDINFQRIPTVDTSDPFASTTIPTNEESLVVIHFRKPDKFKIDFSYLQSKLNGSLSRPDTLVISAEKMALAIEVIFEPIVKQMLERK